MEMLQLRTGSHRHHPAGHQVDTKCPAEEQPPERTDEEDVLSEDVVLSEVHMECLHDPGAREATTVFTTAAGASRRHTCACGWGGASRWPLSSWAAVVCSKCADQHQTPLAIGQRQKAPARQVRNVQLRQQARDLHPVGGSQSI